MTKVAKIALINGEVDMMKLLLKDCLAVYESAKLVEEVKYISRVLVKIEKAEEKWLKKQAL